MISGKSKFLELVDEGRKGHNIGLSVGSPKLEVYMDGYLPGTSYLIGAAPGVGKSTYMLWTFIYQPLMDYLRGNSPERDPYWILFNLEMTQPQIYAKLLSMYIFDTFGEEIRFKEMFSRGKDTILSDGHYELIQKCSDFLDILDERISCHDGSLTEDKYTKILNQELKRFGRWEGNIFIPNNPHQVLGVAVDHMSLVRATPGRTKKDEMDAISRASVMARNATGIVSPIHVAQFNRSSGSDERLKQAMQDPTYTDFKDSGALYEDSQVVIALHSPHKFKLSSYRKYDVKALEQCFLAVFLLKSRFGTSDILVPIGFYGDCSHFIELPKPDEIYDYEAYKTPYWSLKREDTNEKEEIKQDAKKRTKFDYSL